jgi:hypothetical protein
VTTTHGAPELDADVVAADVAELLPALVSRDRTAAG